MVVAVLVAFLPISRRTIAREVTRLTAAEPAPETSLDRDPGRPAPVEPAAERTAEPRKLIETADLVKSFGGVHALQGVSVQVREGELIGLVGPNGSGKTTLVNLLAGAFRPSSGEIRIDGHSTTGMPPHRITHLGVARTYQIPRPFQTMTVRDNVAVAIMFGRVPQSLHHARRAAEEYLALVGMAHLANGRPSEINLHERQLLEMARALATRPRVLLLDEALAGLSPVEVDHAVEVVRRIHASGITIVLVEHLLRVVNQLATRVVVLDQGRLLADGLPDVVMRDPAVVGAYLGSGANA
jgi:branched-chain amino acid transport system permease protein